MNHTAKSNSAGEAVWKFFASVKLSVFLLLALAATSIIGTVVPQNADPGLYIQRYGETAYALMYRLGIFDMYRSFWFQLLLALLLINIIICSLDRLRATWKIIFPGRTLFSTARFRSVRHRTEWTSAHPPEHLNRVFSDYIRRRFSTWRTDTLDDGFVIFGEKWRWTRLGVYGVHLSVVLMVIGGLMGSIFGFDGHVNIPVGEARQSIHLHFEEGLQELPFQIRCDDFSITHWESGLPREYRSTLSIIKDDKTVLTRDVVVNAPLTFEGISIYQSSWGRLPGETFTLTFTEDDTGMVHQKPAVMGEPVDKPGGKGSVIIDNFTPSFRFPGGPALSNVFIGRVISPDDVERSILLPMDHPRFDRMRNGEFTIGISDLEFNYFTGLQVKQDPGIPVVYAGFILIIIGTYITFFMLHQTFCIRLTPEAGGTRVMLAGAAGNNRPGMAIKIDRLADRLKKIADPSSGSAGNAGTRQS
jgi:cytochrome c biogenesis protein